MAWFNRLISLLVILIVLVLLAIWLFSPQIARSVINDSLESYALKLSDSSVVRLNPFLSSLTVNNLVLIKEDQLAIRLDRLQLNYKLFALFSKHIHISEVSAVGFKSFVHIDNESIRIAGLDLNDLTQNQNQIQADQTVEVEQPASEFPFTIILSTIELDDFIVDVTHLSEQHTFRIDRANISDFVYGADKNSVKAEGTLEAFGGKIDFAASLAAENTDTEINAKIKVKNLDLARFQYSHEDISTLKGKLNSFSEFRLKTFGKGLELDVSDFELELADLELSRPDLKAQLNQLRLKTASTTLLAPTVDELNLTTNAQAKLQGLVLQHPTSEHHIAGIGELNLRSITAEYAEHQIRVTVPSAEVTSIKASEFQQDELPNLLLLKRLDLNKIKFSDNRLMIDEIAIGELASQLIIDQSGLVNVVVPEDKPMSATQPSASQSPTNTAIAEKHPAVAQKAPLDIIIGNIQNAKRAQIYVEDRSKKPTFSKTLYIDELLIEDIDSRNKTKYARFDTKLSDNDYMKLAASGKFQPFQQRVNAEIESSLTEFSLPEANRYVSKTLGFEFKAGQLDANYAGNIQDSKLDTNLVLNIRGSKFSASQKDDELNLIGQTAVPLNVALNLLKDKKGNIKLNVPIRGDLNDPEFGVEYLLGLVVKKAVMRQTQNYLMTTFVPYAQVINVALAAGSYALKVRFQDLEYKPGQIALLADQENFVAELTSLMNTKPKLQIKICPIATQLDLTQNESDQERKTALLNLADKRASAFKTAMVENGIESSRLLLCGAKIDQNPEASPRLAFSI